MSNSSTTSGGGLGLASTLGIIFIVLKLVGVISWSWIWVLSPFWIGAIIIVLFLIIIISMFDSSRRW
jgi:ABC-type antimicrobial peptide transport system permease subunit